MNWPSLEVKDPSLFLISSTPQPDRLFVSHSPLYMLHEEKASLGPRSSLSSIGAIGFVILCHCLLFIKEGLVFMLHAGQQGELDSEDLHAITPCVCPKTMHLAVEEFALISGGSSALLLF